MKSTFCIEGKRYGLPTGSVGETLVLYHGTRAPLRKILKEGILVRAGRTGKDTRMQMVDEVLEREFGVTKEQVPSWIWKGEYDYEGSIEPHIHMSVNIRTAAGYAHQGCEIHAEIRSHMYGWLLERRYGPMKVEDQRRRFPKSPGLIACEMNGVESHVFCVEVPVDFVRTSDLELLEGILKRAPGRMDYLNTTTMEVRVVKDIPPQMIKRVWRVYYWDTVGWKYDLVRVR